MTRDRLLEQAIELLAIADFHSVTLKEERNQVVREGIELLRQPKHTEPVCPACALQALHNENERLGLYKDAYGQPEPDELNIAYMSGLYDGKKKRPWAGLTDAEIKAFDTWHDNREEEVGWCNPSEIVAYIEAKLKEKNT
jgi:hypothetical protein